MKLLFDIITSSWFQLIFAFSGWIVASLVTTKTGTKILGILKHFLYLIINPAIIYSTCFTYEFINIPQDDIKDLLFKIYNSKEIENCKLNRNGFKDYECKLRYPGLDYIFNVEETNSGSILYVKILETESNYRNLNTNIKNTVIKEFVQNIVLKQILNTYTSSQFKADYQLVLRFTKPKYNYFVKERFSTIPKGYVTQALISVKDADNDNFILSANLEQINITVRNDFNEFMKILDKYISIV